MCLSQIRVVQIQLLHVDEGDVEAKRDMSRNLSVPWLTSIDG
jgi:hypothetical protein